MQAQAQKQKKNIKKRKEQKEESTEKNAEAVNTMENKTHKEMKKIMERNNGDIRACYKDGMNFLLEEDLKKAEESGNITRNTDGTYRIKGEMFKKYNKKDIIRHLKNNKLEEYNKKIAGYIKVVNLEKKKQENNQGISLLQSGIEKQKDILKEYKNKLDEAERFVKKIEFNRSLASIERHAEDERAQNKRELKSMFNEMDIEQARNISKLRRETDTEIRENRLKDEKQWIEKLHKGFLEYEQQKDERTEEKRKEREEMNKVKQKEKEERDTEREKDMEGFNREMREREQEREKEREMERQREREEFEIRKAKIEEDAERQRRIFDEQERERGEENRRRLERSAERFKNAQMERNKFLREQEEMLNKFSSELEEIRKDRVKLKDGSVIIIQSGVCRRRGVATPSYSIEVIAQNNLIIKGAATDTFDPTYWLRGQQMTQIRTGEHKKSEVCPAGAGTIQDTYTFEHEDGRTETYQITFIDGGQPHIKKIE